MSTPVEHDSADLFSGKHAEEKREAIPLCSGKVKELDGKLFA
jgi:hypothetical protein